jgi:hypothetical protein
MGLHSPIFPQKKAPAETLKPLPIVVPEAGIEPARARGPEDFESLSGKIQRNEGSLANGGLPFSIGDLLDF